MKSRPASSPKSSFTCTRTTHGPSLAEGRTCDLLTYRSHCPFAARNHPTEEHLLPLYVALGAAGEGARAEHLHESASYGVLRMDAYGFHGNA